MRTQLIRTAVPLPVYVKLRSASTTHILTLTTVTSASKEGNSLVHSSLGSRFEALIDNPPRIIRASTRAAQMKHQRPGSDASLSQLLDAVEKRLDDFAGAFRYSGVPCEPWQL